LARRLLVSIKIRAVSPRVVILIRLHRRLSRLRVASLAPLSRFARRWAAAVISLCIRVYPRRPFVLSLRFPKKIFTTQLTDQFDTTIMRPCVYSTTACVAASTLHSRASARPNQRGAMYHQILHHLQVMSCYHNLMYGCTVHQCSYVFSEPELSAAVCMYCDSYSFRTYV
jgi:hypothetical protein